MDAITNPKIIYFVFLLFMYKNILNAKILDVTICITSGRKDLSATIAPVSVEPNIYSMFSIHLCLLELI